MCLSIRSVFRFSIPIARPQSLIRYCLNRQINLVFFWGFFFFFLYYILRRLNWEASVRKPIILRSKSICPRWYHDKSSLSSTIDVSAVAPMANLNTMTGVIRLTLPLQPRVLSLWSLSPTTTTTISRQISIKPLMHNFYPFLHTTLTEQEMERNDWTNHLTSHVIHPLVSTIICSLPIETYVLTFSLQCQQQAMRRKRQRRRMGGVAKRKT